MNDDSPSSPELYDLVRLTLRLSRRFLHALDEPLDAFVGRLESTPARYLVVPFTAAMAVRAHDLPAIPERGDRLIAATALELGYPLVTRDPEIAAAIGADQLW